MAESFRLALVGAGRVAQDWLAVIAESDAFRLAAIADNDASAREAAARTFDVPVFATLSDLLAAEAVDVALVATPPVMHEGLCVELLGRGIDVLCEKPLAPTAAAAQRMVQAAHRGRSTLMMASKFRYVPDLVEARRLLRTGVVGQPVLFDCAFCSRVDMTTRWNADASVSGGGVLIDNGSHAVDVARFLLGPITRVFAHFGRRVQPIRVEDTVRVTFETLGAAVGTFDLSWSLEKGTDHYVSVQGSGGTLEIGWRQSRLRTVGEDWQPFGGGYDKRAAFAAQLADFASVVRDGTEPQVTVEDALASVRAIEAAYRSARVGRWVPLQGFDGGPV